MAGERYHSLDAFRAAMMLLGLVLHSAASYTFNPLREAWPLHDPPGLLAFDILLVFIHLFRMPAFFLVAGFFGALLYYRDGARGMLRNRARRVGVPLILFTATALPLTGLGFLAAARVQGVELPAVLLPQGPLLRRPIFGHLWFLYDLLLFYAAALAVVPLAARLPETVRSGGTATFRTYAVSLPGALCLGLISTATLVPMVGPGLETAASILPPLRILAAYAVFFSFGWRLYSHRDELVPMFGRTWKGFLAIGFVLFLAYLAVLIAQQRIRPRTFHLIAVLFAGPAMWFLIFGLLGLFVRSMPSPRPAVRYLADASYWMYLTHLIPIPWTAALLTRAPLPTFLKFTIVLAVTTGLTLATYRWWVRPTRLGVLLNGPRAKWSMAADAEMRS